MDRKTTLCTCILALALTLPAMAASSVPLLITQQGRLLDASDHPVTGSHSLTMRIYEVPAGGVALWTEVQPSVSISNGLYAVTLGSVTPLSQDLFSPPSPPGGMERWLSVSVDGQAELMPRMRLATVPYALSSSRMDGDVVTTPGEMKITSGSTTGTIRMQAANDSASSVQTLDLNNDGIPEMSIKQKTTSSGAGSLLSGHSGSTTGTIRMVAAPDSLVDVRDCDDDDDGFPEGRVQITVRATDAVGNSATSLELSTDRAAAGPRQTVSLDGSFSHARQQCISDLDRDGIPDVVVASQSSSLGAATKWYVDSDDDGFHESDMEMQCGPGGTTAKSITTKGTGALGSVRWTTDSAVDGASSVVCDHDEDGDSHPDRWIEELARRGVSSSLVAADVDGDGSADNTITSTCDATSCDHAINTKGTGTAGRMLSSGSRSSDDGVVKSWLWSQVPGPLGVMESEQEVVMQTDPDSASVSVADKKGGKGTVSILGGMSGSTTGTIRMAASPDLTHDYLDHDDDGDGIAENSMEMQCASGGTTLKGIARGGSTTGTIRMSATGGGPILPECVSSMEMDNNGDSHPDRWIEELARYSSASSLIAADVDGDGVADNTASTDCDDTDARHVIQARSGSTTATIRSSATAGGIGLDPEAVWAMEITNTGDSHRSRWLEVDMRSPAGSGNMVIATDTDDDGVADNTVTEDCDDTDAKIVVATSGHSGVSMVSDASGGRIAVDTIPTTHKVSIGGGGAYCDGTDWVNGSDVASKENFVPVNGKDLLERIARLEITRWNYKGQPQVEHIGPMAQDFKAAFGLGANDKTISTVDPSGIALAAIKVLEKQNQDLQTQNKELREALENLSRKVDKLAASR